MTKKRLQYIDIAKGLLIISVIINHIRVFSAINGYDVNLFSIINTIELLWLSFFMQCFFFITGYCSNYKKDWKSFIKDSARTILFPIVPIWFSVLTIRIFLEGNYDFQHIEDSYLRVNLHYWFLLAIFIGKIIYYHISKYTLFRRIIFTCILYLLGFIFWAYQLVPNIWYFEHSLLLLPFLFIGDYFKINNINIKTYISAGIIYIITLITSLKTGIGLTIIANDIHLTWNNILICLILGTSGSIAFIGCCKYIKSNIFLEFLGKNTLPIFMIHMTCMLPWLDKFRFIFEYNPYLYWISILIITILLCCIYIYILNTKYFKWMLGKF